LYNTPLKTIGCTWPWDDKLIVDDNCVNESMDYLLYDDDTITKPDYPDLSLMNSVFYDCYIYSLDDGGGNMNWKQSNRPFNRNLTTGDWSSVLNPDSASVLSSDFWTVYLCGVFQPEHDHDNDPISEQAYFGQATQAGPGNNQGVIFIEVFEDIGSTCENQVVVHEIGHQFGLDHEPDTIMNSTMPVDHVCELFCPDDIAIIRGISHP